MALLNTFAHVASVRSQPGSNWNSSPAETGERYPGFTYTTPCLMSVTVRLDPAFAPLTPVMVPCTYRVAGLETTAVAICVGVEPAPERTIVCRPDRSNWHIASPNTCVQDDCQSRRGI